MRGLISVKTELWGLRERRISTLRTLPGELLVWFLAWNYAPDQYLQHSHGYVRVVEYRRKMSVMLDVSPSLRPTIPEDLTECYADAHAVASGETGLPLDVVPLTCPWTAAQVVCEAL
jgi:hypothetical protein